MKREPILFGISAFQHDAAVAVVRGGEILFAAHSERYSRRKNDPDLCQPIVDDAIAHGGPPDRIVFYERPMRTHLRRLRAGQSGEIFDNPWPARNLRALRGLERAPISYVGHHLAHACGGFFTSSFEEAAVVVADGVGEFDSLTVWHARGRSLRRVFRVRYPHSLGLLYSAFTRRTGFKPNEEEFIMMGLAAYGTPRYHELIREDFLVPVEIPQFQLRCSVHGGVDGWRPELKQRQDIASSVQKLTEDYMLRLLEWVAMRIGCRHLVYSGGVALNCILNGRIARLPVFDDIWIMPNPGDAGSSLGAALAYSRRKVRWATPYLGHEIARPFDAAAAARALAAGRVIGVANGRAEFGPRALGNRSLLADPRSRFMKGRVNDVKGREPFRPFAPAVQAEHAAEYFDLPRGDARYMQYAVPCRCADKIPAVCHVDGTSRIQVVSASDNPNLYNVLEGFRRETGCPVLLNTSLNVKGQPLVNDWEQARQLGDAHGIPVF
jgi:carbamoyltransferase